MNFNNYRGPWMPWHGGEVGGFFALIGIFLANVFVIKTFLNLREAAGRPSVVVGIAMLGVAYCCVVILTLAFRRSGVFLFI